MITNYQSIKTRSEERMTNKNLDTLFLRAIEDGAHCSPFVAKAILATAQHVYGLDAENDENRLQPGQLYFLGVSDQEPSGKPLANCKMKNCILTLHQTPDDEKIRYQLGVTAVRRKKILRLTTEALEQSVLLSYEDLAYKILNCGLRTIVRDIKALRHQNIFVPTRGQQKGIGPGVSHKVLAVELFLQRKNEQEIARLIYHNIRSVENYTMTFLRVVLLLQEQHATTDIAFLLQISPQLVTQYQDLYQRYRNSEYQTRLEELLDYIKQEQPQLNLKKTLTPEVTA